MLRLALRNLLQTKVRLVIATGGVALALMLILALDAIFVGVERQISAYIDYSGADIWVSQAGVRNLHMASSSLPVSIVRTVGAVPGVESATPILYVSNMIVIGNDRHLAYVIGLPPDATAGKPWRIVEGSAIPREGEVIIDWTVAEKSGVRVGDTVAILGQRFTIAGLAQDTATLTSSVAFISLADFARLRGSAPVISFILVQVKPGESPAVVATRIESAGQGVTALPRSEFARQERKVVKDMATDVLTIMNSIGFVIGLAVMALTVYTATLARRREYGMLKALGARNGHLYRAVVAQALYSVVLGFVLGLTFTLLLSGIVPLVEPTLVLRISAASLLKAGMMALVIAALAAILPIRQISGLDPALVFRRGVT